MKDSWHPFDQFLLESLTWRIRVAREGQIETVGKRLFKLPNVGRRISSLIRNKWLEVVSTSIPEIELNSPIFIFDPSKNNVPDFGKICWVAEKRCQRAAVHVQQIYYATKSAELMFGGVGGGLRQPFQLVHDLGTTSAFLAGLSAVDCEQRRNWFSEDVLRRYFRSLNLKKIPDAAEVCGGIVVKVFDFVGRDYSAKTLRKFHRYWSVRQIPYELW